MLLALGRRAASRQITRSSQQRACSGASKGASAAKVDAEKERAARVVFGQSGEPPKMPYAQMAFTAFVLGSYVAYVKLIEEPAEEAELLAHPQPAIVPLPQGAVKRLPDGRLVMDDGSIQRAPS